MATLIAAESLSRRTSYPSRNTALIGPGGGGGGGGGGAKGVNVQFYTLDFGFDWATTSVDLC